MGSIHYRPAQRLALLENQEASRYVDMGLVVVGPDDAEIYRVGGKWDRERRCYAGEAETGRVVKLKHSQVEAAQWFAGWLDDKRANKHRDHVLFLGGPRRGGKSFGGVLNIVSLCLETPGAVTWIISPTIELREEIERWFGGEPDGRWQGLPEHWVEYRATPQFKYYFENGSTCRNVSGAIPSRMKRGKSHGFLINEAQEQADAVATYSVPSVIDTGGHGIFAANPPDKPKGQWINGFREKLKGVDEEGRELVGEVQGQYFWIDPSKNDAIDQGVRAAVAVTLGAINEDAAKRDAAGQWLPVGELAYPKFIARPAQKGGMIAPVPDTLRDITRETLRRCGAPQRDYVIGADFQEAYAMAASIYRVFERPSDKLPLYWLIDEVLVDGNEADLSDEILDLDGGYTQENSLWIPDATGEMQDGKHSKRNTSFGQLKRLGWRVIPPTEKVNEDSKNAVNPRVYRRLAMMYKLMEDGRFFVAPHCKIAIEAFAKCPLKKGRYGGHVPYGKYSHPTDGAGYPLWKLEPETKRRATSDPSKWLDGSTPLRTTPG